MMVEDATDCMVDTAEEATADQEQPNGTEEEDNYVDGDDDEADNESSDDDQVEFGVQVDMENLQKDFPGFRSKYRLIKRIGEG